MMTNEHAKLLTGRAEETSETLWMSIVLTAATLKVVVLIEVLDAVLAHQDEMHRPEIDSLEGAPVALTPTI